MAAGQSKARRRQVGVEWRGKARARFLAAKRATGIQLANSACIGGVNRARKRQPWLDEGEILRRRSIGTLKGSGNIPINLAQSSRTRAASARCDGPLPRRF